mgnify:FL=1
MMGTMHLMSPTGFSVANCNYVSGDDGSVTSDETDPQAVFFKDDGTKMYVVGLSSDTVYQYALSTAWDPSSKGAVEASFSVSFEDNQPQGLAFSDDGTKMYMSGSQNEEVFEYSLSTAWDVSTATYTFSSLSVSTEGTNPGGIWFKPDGTKLFVLCDSNDTVFQYSLSTAWDITSASYDSKSFSISTQESQSGGICFTSDGGKMLAIGNLNNTIYEYDLSTDWDVSTAAYNSVSKDVSSQDSLMYDVFITDDDTLVFTVGSTNDKVYKYA